MIFKFNNKAEAGTISKVVSITIILVVLFIIYLFLPKSILNAGKDFYNSVFGDDEIVIDYEQADQTAKLSFDTMANKIQECKKTKGDCLCSVNLNAFYSFYILNLKSDKIEMINDKEGSNLFVKEAENIQINCYMDKKGDRKQADALLFESQGKPYIDKGYSAIRKSFTTSKAEKNWINPTTNNLLKVSDTQFCWVLEDPVSRVSSKTKEC